MSRSITVTVVSAILGLTVGAGAAHAQSSYEQQVVALTNQQRTAQGCGALAENPALMNAAGGHSADMAARDQMSHYGANGEDPGNRIAKAGYPARRWAENVAYNQPTPREVVNTWMTSPGHRANILDCNLADIGVGYAVNNRGEPYWTQDFGAQG
jgi:uncharacterized protein YkwD